MHGERTPNEQTCGARLRKASRRNGTSARAVSFFSGLAAFRTAQISRGSAFAVCCFF
jgi:hypothetical protein